MQPRAPTGFQFAPLLAAPLTGPIQLCLLVRPANQPGGEPFVLLRELPGVRVYLGATCDADARVQDWMEIWVQTLELRDLSFSSHQERLTNRAFDERWQLECSRAMSSVPDQVLLTGMEQQNPRPLLLKRAPNSNPNFISVAAANWEICRDNALLETNQLPAYSSTPFRYLHDPAAAGIKTFLATAPDAPTTPQVLSADELAAAPDVRAVFNAHAGFIRAVRFAPLELEALTQILEGRAWKNEIIAGTKLAPGLPAELETWSAEQKGISFLLHTGGNRSERLLEVFYLKLALLRDLFYEVSASVKAAQLPLLNVTPASFRVGLQDSGAQFPALWSAKATLVKPGQAHALQIQATEQRYFVRLGRIEPSPFLPEGLGAHSFGIGNIRLREVLSDANGLQLEGTLEAEDYLRVATTDLLWFKLPWAGERLEFYAHLHSGEAVGPKEARFRTVPAKLPDAIVASLKQACGSPFQKSPYEIWPLLSSPCDLYSLGIIGVRLLLANHTSKFPVIVDEFLGLARRLGKTQPDAASLRAQLQAVLAQDPKILDLISPHNLLAQNLTPAQARELVNPDLWFDAVCLLLRLFPGAGPQSYCQSFGDVSPLALETVFTQPLQELETLLLRLRSILTPSLCANEEIAAVLRQKLAAG